MFKNQYLRLYDQKMGNFPHLKQEQIAIIYNQIGKQIYMKSPAFSKKDAQIIQTLYKNVIQNYYQNPSASNISSILLLNDLIIQSVSQKQDLNCEQIVVKLEVLKIKAKGCQQLRNSIQKTVEHMKHPKKVPLQQKTLQQCLKQSLLYSFGCMMIQRQCMQTIKNNSQGFDVNRILLCVVEGVKYNFNACVETVSHIINNTPETVINKQSNIMALVDEILNNHITEMVKQKLGLSRCLKIIWVAAKLQKTVMYKKQRKLSLAIYSQPSSVLQVQEILQICYHEAYCHQILNSPIDVQQLDAYYVWSYCSAFCIQASKSHIEQLETLLLTQRIKPEKAIKADFEFKIYTTINNIVTINNFSINFAWTIPIHLQLNLYPYLLLVYTILQHHPNDVNQNFNLSQIEKICNQNKGIGQNAKRLLKRIKSLGVLSLTPSQKNLKSSHHLSDLSFSSPEKEPQTFLPKAMKIPKNDADLERTHEILTLESNVQDEQLHKDNIRSLKNRASDSLRVSLIQNQFTSLQKIFNNLNIDQYDPITLKKLLQMTNLYLKMNPGSVSSFNLPNLVKVILKFDEKNRQFMNFQQLGEILYQCLGSQQWNIEKYADKTSQQWKNHIIQKLKNLKIISQEQKKPETLLTVVEMINRLSVEHSGQFIMDQEGHQNKNKKTQNNQETINIFNILNNHNNTQGKQIQNSSDTPPIRKQESESIMAKKQEVMQKIEIKNIILKFKIQDLLKRWKKRAKKSKQRFYKLKEWMDTENSYMQKLLVLRDQVRNPLLSNNIINEIQSMQIFCNLDAMIQLCQEMRKNIKQLVDNFNYIFTELAPSLKVVTNYLKIYKQYSLNYQKSYETMKHLQQQQGYKDIVKVVGLQNYLFSPVQRFQKYHLFVSDYLKSLLKQHKDYDPLQKALQMLLKVTDQINQFIQAQNKSKKMLQLQKIFGNVVTSTSARHYKTQFAATCWEFKCKVFIFNDLILVAKIVSDSRLQIYSRLELCGSSFVVHQPDCISFKNRLYVGGTDTSIHLTFSDSDELERAYNLINTTLESLYQKQFMRHDLISQSKSRLVKVPNSRSSVKNQQQWKQQVYYNLKIKAQVIAIEKRPYGQILKTIFVIKIELPKPDEISQLLFCQLQTLSLIQKHLRELHKNIKIPSFYLASRNSTPDDLIKMTEHLCVITEIFLNYVIRNKQISKKPQLLLHQLGFHQGIWNYLNISNATSECMCDACLHAEIFTGIDFYYKQKQLIQSKKYKFCILNAFRTQNTIRSLVERKMLQDFSIQSKLVWANCKLKKIDYRLQNKTQFGNKLFFKVHVRLISEQVSIKSQKSTIYTNAREVIEEICKKLGIQTTLDLALVLVQDKHQTILNDDQMIEPIIRIIKQAQYQVEKAQINSRNSQRSSLFSRLSWANSSISTKQRKKVSLHLRKLCVFNQSLEEGACQDNPERYQLIVGQMIRKFKDQTLILNPEDIRALCALTYCIQNFSTLVIEKKVSIQPQKLKKYLPESKWSIINPQFIQKMTHIIENQFLLTDKINLLYRCILKQLGQKFTWHCQYFPVLNTQSSLLLGNFSKLNIGVSYKKIAITRQKTTIELLSYAISEIKYHIYGESLFIETEEKTHRFIGENLIELDKLLQTYKLIYDFEHQNN